MKNLSVAMLLGLSLVISGCSSATPVAPPTAPSATASKTLPGHGPKPRGIIIPLHHIYVPLPHWSTIQAYETGSGANMTGAQFYIESTALKSPTMVAADPKTSTIYVYNDTSPASIVAFTGIDPNSTGQVTPTSAQTTVWTVPYDASDMTVGPAGNLIVVSYDTGDGGAYWYNSAGKLLASIKKPNTWTSVASDRIGLVLFANIPANKVEAWVSSPTPTGANAICSFSAAPFTASPFLTGYNDSNFAIGVNGQSAYVAVTHQFPYTPSEYTWVYVTSSLCTNKTIGTLESLPNATGTPQDGNGNDATYVSGMDVDPPTANIALATVPLYNSVMEAWTKIPPWEQTSPPAWTARLEVWTSFVGTTSEAPNAYPNGYGVNALPNAYYMGKPAYGP